MVAASVSGALAHWRRSHVDIKMGLVLLAGGITGSSVGVWLFTLLRGMGHIDLVISLSYVTFLSIVGTLMVFESVRAWIRSRGGGHGRRKLLRHTWMHRLPFKMRFRRSQLYISGGFVMVPAMIYLLGMPTSVVVGTSLFQIIFVTANVTFLQSVNNQTVDVVLALLLLTGGVIGAQLGTMFGARLRAVHLRGLLGLLVLVVGFRVAYGLMVTPDDLYTLAGAGAAG